MFEQRIDFNNLTCLNEAEEDSAKKVFKPYERRSQFLGVHIFPRFFQPPPPPPILSGAEILHITYNIVYNIDGKEKVGRVGRI